MIRRHQPHRRHRKIARSFSDQRATRNRFSIQGQLLVLYRELSESLETLSARHDSDEVSTIDIALAVVLEDLTALVEECEQYLITQPGEASRCVAHLMTMQEWDSFQARAATVLEEVKLVLSPLPVRRRQQNSRGLSHHF